MERTKNRRDIIKLLVLSGFSLYLPSCSRFEKEKGTRPNPTKDSVDKAIKAIENELTKDTVTYIERTSPQYESLRQGFNLNTQKYPLLIALCKNTEEVAEAIHYANANGLKVAVKSGGHSFEGFSSIDGGLQINLSLMRDLTLHEDHSVTIAPACTLGEMYDALLPKQRLLPAGSCGTVGIGGLTLGGGYGFFSRTYGLTCDHLIAATFVDGTGKIHITTTADDLM